MKRIAVLMTCHNRKAKTIRCLRNLYCQNINLDIFLVNDGCTDGTEEFVAKEFPKVNIIEGDRKSVV